jgi:hypothetical protein
MRGAHSPLEEALGALREDNASGGARNCLVAYTTVESEEEIAKKLEKVAGKAARSVNGIARELGADAVIVFPFAHSPVEPATPLASLQTIVAFAAQLRELSAGDYAVLRAPFGSHKIREGRILGHKKAVLLRKYRV